MKSIFTIFTFLFIFSQGLTQSIVVTNTQTPQQLINGVLLGSGVTAFNIMINGNLGAANTPIGSMGYFTNSNPTFPISSGLVLTTGNASGAIGPNNSTFSTNNTPPTASVSGDPHLNDIANGSVENGIVLEFDFIPSGDTLFFNYMFGSDEYPEFSPSSFNDAFGLFLWGPGISGPHILGGYPNGGANIAVIPGGIPVTINNVGDQSNTSYYVFNEAASTPTYGDAIQYDGTTVLLTASADVQCNEVYHIKLAISNVGDQSYDSGVFLEAGSFNSDAVNVSVATVSGDTTIVEGCTYADFIFTRPDTQVGDTLIINYTITGTATQGVDYNSLLNPIIFLPGVDTVIINLTPIQDGLLEGFESVTISVALVNPCGDTIFSQGTIYIGDGPIINITESDPVLLCAVDNYLITASAAGGYAPYTYTWTSLSGTQLSTNDSLYINVSQNGTTLFLITAVDNCNFSQTDTATVTMNQTIAIDTIYIFPSSCQPTGAVSAVASGTNGIPSYTWTGPGPNGFIDASVWQNLPSGWYFITVTDDVCEVSDSAFIDILNPPIASFQAIPTTGCAPLDVAVINNSQNGTAYNWNFGNGQTNNVVDLNPQNTTYSPASAAVFTIQLIVTQGALCSDTAYSTITVEICGCNDPTALNFNSNASQNDGSCIYPIPPNPEVEAPNVFTPNNDDDNDEFFLTSKNLASLNLVIVNRWGLVVFDKLSTDLVNDNPSWDGKVGQNTANEGVYFYKYTAIGINGQELVGHGFLHLYN